MSEIEFRVLGPLEVLRGGESLELGAPKQRALLALLVVHANELLSADRLIDELWGERAPRRARHALQVYVSALRKLLEPSRGGGGPPRVLQTRDPGYVLRLTPERCDFLRFESLVAEGRQALDADRPDRASAMLGEALELWRGPALADLAYEPFAVREADRLTELRLAATEARLEADLRLGRHAAAVGELEALTAEHPLRERLWAMLMLALYRTGRQADALGAFGRLRETLREELGLDPGPELRGLEEAILRQAPELDWRPPEHPADGDPAPAGPRAAAEHAPEKAAEEAAGGAAGEDAAPGALEERRPVTVVFAELHGFAEVTERMDPEDAHTVVDRCMRRLGEIVADYGGHLDTIVGGRLMAVFGSPVAHEDDPERAVRAALAMQRCAAEHEDDFGGPLRVGVNTGEMVLGPMGPAPGGEPSVIGDAVTVASSLVAAAPPGSVYVGQATHAATGDAVTYEPASPVRVDGRRRPLLVWRAAAVALPPHSRPFGRARLVGRESELDLLRTIWRRAAAERRPHLVTVLGEPGVGKTRLAAELERTLAAAGTRVLHGQCLPYGEALSYGPLVTALSEAAGILPEDGRPSARAKLEELVWAVPLAAESSPGEVARHLALLTGLDTDEDRAPGTPDEKALHASTRRFLEGLGRREPICLSIEDVHWADDALLDLVQSVVVRARDTSLLILAQARPELLERRSAWGGGAAASTCLPLGSLDGAGTRELVAELERGRGLTPSGVDEIVRLSGGNPLFVEELVATLVETGALTAVPSSIRSLLLARLDLLPAPERTVLQLGSVLGTALWPAALRSLGADGPLSDLLDELERRDILRPEARSRFVGETEYAFKHVLIRDVAYETLSRRRRSELHRRAREWIEEAAGERVEEHLDELAHHAVRAGEREEAVSYLSKAAEQAHRSAAHAREAELLRQAIGLAEREVPEEELAHLRARRGRALARVGGWLAARPELEAAAGALPSRRPERLEVLLDLAGACEWCGDIPASHRYADEALALAADVGREDLTLAAMGLKSNADIADGATGIALERDREVLARCRDEGLPVPHARMAAYPMVLYWSGRAREAVEFVEGALAAGREAPDVSITLWNLPHLGLGLAALGEYARAMDAFGEVERLGPEYEAWPLLARSISMCAGVHLDLLDFEGAEALDARARELARSVNFQNTVVSAGINLLFGFLRRGEVGWAERLRDEVVDDVHRAEGSHGWLWRLRFSQAGAELALARGEVERSLELGADAMEQASSKGRVKYEVLSLLTHGTALHTLGRTKDALPHLRRALELARSLGDPSLILRAGGSLAAIEGGEGEDDARDAAGRITSALPAGPLRRRFEGLEAIRMTHETAGP